MKHLTTVVSAMMLLFAALSTLASDRGAATAIAWSPDGHTIAVASRTGLWLFDTDFNEIGHMPIPRWEGYLPTTIEWHASGNLIVLGNHLFMKRYDHKDTFSGDFPVLVIDVKELQVISSFNFPRLTGELHWHPQLTLLAANEENGTVKIVDGLTGEIQFVYRESKASSDQVYHKLTAVCWHSDSAVIVVSHNTVYVFDYVSGETLRRLEMDKGYLSFETASCDNRGRIITDLGYYIHVVAGTIKQMYRLDSTFTFKDYWYDEWDIVDIQWSPDGSQIATNGNAGLCRIGVFDGETFTLLAELQGSHAQKHGRAFDNSIAWHPDGSRFAIVGKLDIRVWDANSYQLLTVFEGFDKRNPRPRDSSDSAATDQIVDPDTWGVHCPSLPASSPVAPELRLAAATTRLRS